MVCVPLRYVSVTLESKFRVRGAMRGNDGRDAVTGATRGLGLGLGLRLGMLGHGL